MSNEAHRLRSGLIDAWSGTRAPIGNPRHRDHGRTLATVVFCLLSAWSALALGAGGFAIETGTTEGDSDVDRFGGVVKWDWGVHWFEAGDWFLGGYWEGNVSYWDGNQGRTGEDSLVDFGLTPVFRYQHGSRHGFAPFMEFAVGAHVHTEDGIENKNFDVPFAFGTHLGLGTRFGSNGQYELIYRFQHLSNAGLGDDNPGINFHVLHLGYWF